MKNKTLAAWLAFLVGPLGLHRFYLHGFRDTWGWVHPIPTALGIYGVRRMQQLGQDDVTSWWLIPFLGVSIAVCALTAIVYGLASPENWNAKFNHLASPTASQGQTNWFTIAAVVLSLLIGTGVLMASLAFGIQHYFEYQIGEARKISQ